jgi:hypothetical protein
MVEGVYSTTNGFVIYCGESNVVLFYNRIPSRSITHVAKNLNSDCLFLMVNYTFTSAALKFSCKQEFSHATRDLGFLLFQRCCRWHFILFCTLIFFLSYGSMTNVSGPPSFITLSISLLVKGLFCCK